MINNLGDTQFDGYITMNGCYCLEGTNNVILKHRSFRCEQVYRLHATERRFPCLFVEEHELSINYVDEQMAELMRLLQKSPSVNALDLSR